MDYLSYPYNHCDRYRYDHCDRYRYDHCDRYRYDHCHRHHHRYDYDCRNNYHDTALLLALSGRNPSILLPQLWR